MFGSSPECPFKKIRPKTTGFFKKQSLGAFFAFRKNELKPLLGQTKQMRGHFSPSGFF
jgi:hypothetical protein